MKPEKVQLLKVQSVMVWGATSFSSVCLLSFMEFTVNAAVYQEILEHLMFPTADKVFGHIDLIFQEESAPVHKVNTCFNNHGITVLDWPANPPDMNPKENAWGIVKWKMRD